MLDTFGKENLLKSKIESSCPKNEKLRKVDFFHLKGNEDNDKIEQRDMSKI